MHICLIYMHLITIEEVDMILNPVAQTIRRIRFNLFLEQEEFAQALGITKSAVSCYEKGARMPRISIIKKIIDLAREKGVACDVEEFLK